MRSAGFAVINVGKTGTGKTTVSKSMLTNWTYPEDLYIYDVNGEYKDVYPEAFVGFQDFMFMVQDVTNSLILIEEATIFFSVKSTNDILQELLVRKRHTNNIIYLNFHSIRAIPRYVFDLVDWINIFKTNDNLNTVKEKYSDPRFIEAFLKVKKDKNKWAFITLKLN